jgi:hypothetical protein
MSELDAFVVNYSLSPFFSTFLIVSEVSAAPLLFIFSSRSSGRPDRIIRWLFSVVILSACVVGEDSILRSRLDNCLSLLNLFGDSSEFRREGRMGDDNDGGCGDDRKVIESRVECKCIGGRDDINVAVSLLFNPWLSAVDP